jgi:hypothetical protein
MVQWKTFAVVPYCSRKVIVSYRFENFRRG